MEGWGWVRGGGQALRPVWPWVQERGGGDYGEAPAPRMPSSLRKLLQSLGKLLICVLRGIQSTGAVRGRPSFSLQRQLGPCWFLLLLETARRTQGRPQSESFLTVPLFPVRGSAFPPTVLGASKSPAFWAPCHQRFNLPFMLGCRCLVVWGGKEIWRDLGVFILLCTFNQSWFRPLPTFQDSLASSSLDFHILWYFGAFF